MKTLAFSLLLLSIQQGSEPVQSKPEAFENVRAYLKISDELATAGMITSDQVPWLREAGFQVVVNLAPAHEERNYLEGFNVAKLGLTHIHIPVSWEKPELRDLQLFFDVMDANADRNVFVHCNANMRVSVFVYLYRTFRLGIPEEEAKQDMLKIWDPSKTPQWGDFITKATRKYRGQDKDHEHIQ